MSCPHRQRRCKHALSAFTAAMYMYSAVQQSVANGEDAEWDEECEDEDADFPIDPIDRDGEITEAAESQCEEQCTIDGVALRRLLDDESQ